jgi:DNA-binding transcriptional LysR family regulator
MQLLLALSRLGSMRAVADAHHLTTSTVSQQIAALANADFHAAGSGQVGQLNS